MKLKLKKCEFVKKSVELLENIVCAHEISVNPQKIQAIANAPIPFDATSL